jgi:glutamyl-tRNA synthetase
MTPKVRFAPSPTGYIHIGNARTALLNWLYAKRNGGTFLLRLDDTDVERSKPEFADAIIEDLDWLGIVPDETMRQSDRTDVYDAAAEKLKSVGRLYACYETPDELERKRKRLLGRGKPPVYDRAGLNLDAADIAAFEAEGRTPHWRFLLEDRSVAWRDEVRGKQHIEAGSLSDPVLIRADGSYLYTLPSVLDDIDCNVTLVCRGEDHVTNTGVQIQLFEALGATPPGFAHHNLLTDASGAGLSKRMASLSLRSLRADGFEAMAVASLASIIGTSDPVAPHASMNALVALFDFGKLSRAPARFDFQELEGLNAKLLHQLPFEQVKDRLAEIAVADGEEFWNAVRGNLEKFSEVALWWQVVSGEIKSAGENSDFLGEAAKLLPKDPWNETTWGEWTKQVKDATGAKGRDLFHPLRLALTGQDRGPEMSTLLPLMGREKTLQRLKS